MARNSEAYERKRGEILEAAWGLFQEKGYDKATVDGVIDRAGISKGTFYHYFSSKADLLDGVVERLTLQGYQELRPILADPERPPLERLKDLLDAARGWRVTNLDRIRPVMEVMLRDENAVIRMKMYQRTAALMVPHLTEIIARGVESGDFRAVHPRETAEILMGLGRITAELNSRDLLGLEEKPGLARVVRNRIQVYLESLGRILGLDQGALGGLGAGFGEQVIAAFEEGRGKGEP